MITWTKMQLRAQVDVLKKAVKDEQGKRKELEVLECLVHGFIAVLGGCVYHAFLFVGGRRFPGRKTLLCESTYKRTSR